MALNLQEDCQALDFHTLICIVNRKLKLRGRSKFRHVKLHQRPFCDIVERACVEDSIQEAVSMAAAVLKKGSRVGRLAA